MKIQHHPGTPCNIKVQECYEKIPLIDEKWGFSFPEKLEIELTRKCNLNCIHCWNNSPKENEEFPFELIKENVNGFRGLDIKFTGGEPLLYNSFIQLLDLCKENEHNIEINTNGTLIDKNVSNILKRYTKRINISLHGSTKEIHEDVTKKYGSYNKTIDGIKTIQNSELNSTINYTVMRQNLDDITNMMFLAKKLNVESLRFNILRNCGRGKTLEQILPEEVAVLRKNINNSEIGIKLEKSELYTSGYLMDLDDSKFYGCGGMRNQVYISSNGDVSPCSLSKNLIGNIKQEDLVKI